MVTSQSVVRNEGGQDTFYKLSTLLPTGTFLALQTVAPLFTNNGVCGRTERIMTGLLVFTFTVINVLLTFTDSILVKDGQHYYGMVTTKGLYNPRFQKLTIRGTQGSLYYADPKYNVNRFDFINAIATVAVFNTIVLLTPPVSQCFFPTISDTLNKSIPVLVGIIVGLYFSFVPSPRKGIGYSLNGLVAEVPDDGDEETGTRPVPASPGKGAAQSLPEPKKQTNSTTPAPAASPAAGV